MPDVLNQGDDESCVAQSVAALIWTAHVRAGVTAPSLLSRKALWWLCRHETGSHRYNVGTQHRTAFRLMNRLGFCRERWWSHDRPFANRPAVEASQRMIDQRDTGSRVDYRRLTETGPDLLRALRCAICADLPVAIGLQVNEPFARSGFHPEAAVGPPAAGEITWGHSVVVCAYHDDDFLIQSSWGTRWGDAGRAWITSAYAMTARDPWTVVSAPEYSDHG
jgi:hypothetical protein